MIESPECVQPRSQTTAVVRMKVPNSEIQEVKGVDEACCSLRFTPRRREVCGRSTTFAGLKCS